jgi:hypothetical protein
MVGVAAVPGPKQCIQASFKLKSFVFLGTIGECVFIE